MFQAGSTVTASYVEENGDLTLAGTGRKNVSGGSIQVPYANGELLRLSGIGVNDQPYHSDVTLQDRWPVSFANSCEVLSGYAGEPRAVGFATSPERTVIATLSVDDIEVPGAVTEIVPPKAYSQPFSHEFTAELPELVGGQTLTLTLWDGVQGNEPASCSFTLPAKTPVQDPPAQEPDDGLVVTPDQQAGGEQAPAPTGEETGEIAPQLAATGGTPRSPFLACGAAALTAVGAALAARGLTRSRQRACR